MVPEPEQNYGSTMSVCHATSVELQTTPNCRSVLAFAVHFGHYALSMGHADDIWNRACAEAGQPKTLTASGDRALADMVLTHSLAMNGGLLHAVQSCTPDEVAAAVRGYRFFGLESAAAVLEDVARSWADGSLDLADEEQLENEANERYYAAVPDDEVLMAAFVARVQAEPTAFDTIR